ncbi:hypothetical protein Q1695_002170 [Nippostrongylus brasiliensis]|nr:hypothetical protein Q1695_002170 [Nippostrongylus brasiliensis]
MIRLTEIILVKLPLNYRFRWDTIEAAYVVMVMLRFLRRRGFGIAWRAFLGCSVVFFTVQIANTFPPLSHKDRENGFYGGIETGGQEEIRVVNRRSNNVDIAPGNVPSPQSLLHENEFYENIIVHFDLKGAPPKVPYFLELLQLVARSGATGILLEWEEMFPWSGQLAAARSSDAYSMSDVRTILKTAKSLNLDIIPLMQTFGHLEWILKLKQFRKYRENDAYPQVLCLGDEEGVALVKDALNQVIDVHKEFGIKYFHIGADEAFEFGVCEKSRKWIADHGAGADKQLLALSHLKDIALHVKGLVNGVTVLAWHDMLKDFDMRLIGDLHLGVTIEPVIWDYSENIVTMADTSFSQIAHNFPVVWASSAYKGANFPSAKYIDIRHYETNNMAWIDTKIAQQSKFVKFGGIIITGWQRYDHMAALCEILPMGTPSMVLNVQYARMAPQKDQHLARHRAAVVLGCRDFHVGGLELISNVCNFTGFDVYALFQGTAQQTLAYVQSELDRNHHIMGWLSPYSRRYNFTQNWYLEQIRPLVQALYSQMQGVEQSLRMAMRKYFFDNAVDEFIFLTLSPMLDKLQGYLDEIKRLSVLREYPKRPFKI